ncbi:hypothetical protein [Hyphomicrobium sp. CS1GBMeth3]|uniref:hypothetical protein n=1 Tax=Hyphomicrobium sp. CS1GBMeth3 TaxID=1892845 RepID=UPI000931ED85|nr:hypothetical protein [Hyphomicrobium sp. CS1GBMeth3]
MNKVSNLALLIQIAVCTSVLAVESELHTPNPGTPERKAIMDAIRLGVCRETIFKVHHLKIMRLDKSAIAVAEVSDASEQTECGGIVFLEALNQQWRANFLMDAGGGSALCTDAKSIHETVLARIDKFGSPRTILPAGFWLSLKEATDGAISPDIGCGNAEKL